jgi:hypothetical protein
MDRPLTLLIVGGYGTFGGRLARLLSDVDGLTLLIGGRSLERAEEFCLREAPNRPTDGATYRPVRFDRDAAVEPQLRALAPEIVVDASGPFQSYGDYRLVEACIACGVHYLDLADSADFVCGVDRFEQRARERGVFVLSGVSSFPVLTAAAVRLLSADMARVDAITGGIAPSPFANVGLNVIRAIAAYAGRPIRVIGGPDPAGRVAYPFTESVRCTIAAPGCVPLDSRAFSLVEVPDLRLLAQLWPQCRSIWMGAAPVPAIWHRVLRGLALLVRLRVLPSLSFLAALMHGAIHRLRWGEHRGGMFVRVAGANASGARVVLAWHLIAEGDAGPFIPSMAVEAIVRRYLLGMRPAVGARAAIRELEVSDYEPLLTRRAIRFGVRDDTPASGRAQSLYQRILGPAWHALPASLRVMHSVSTSLVASGRADVTRGAGRLASLVASVIGFPARGTDIPVEVRFDVTASRETWTRRFAARSFASQQFPGTRRWDRLVCERFGPITLALALVVDDARLRLIVRGWSVLGIPLPRALAPYCVAHEHESSGRFHFDVAIGHRWTGLIVHYRGWLIPGAPVAQEVAGGASPPALEAPSPETL